jgi:hypothetical protein
MHPEPLGRVILNPTLDDGSDHLHRAGDVDLAVAVAKRARRTTLLSIYRPPSLCVNFRLGYVNSPERGRGRGSYWQFFH